MQFSTTTAFALLALATSGTSHMVMKTPTPFGNPNNSPLDPSGSDFPCKGVSYDRGAVTNVMPVGDTLSLSFTGSAVHGGGSCQLSLTTDLNPTASSKWMVIKSIEGGCPSNVAGNLPEDPNGSGASKFQFSIPEGIAPGEYVFAWTWHNKVGNREMYMNCAPATVTGAKKKRYVPSGVSIVRRQSQFPDMFVANIARVNDCKTPESFDYNYPNPGPVVEKAGTGPYQQLSCGGSGNTPVQQPSGGTPAGPGAGGPGAAPSGGAAVPSGTAPTAGGAQPTGAGNGNGNGQGAGNGQGSGAGNGQGQGSSNGQGAGNGQGQGAGNGQGQGNGFGSGFGSGSGSGSSNNQGGSPTVAPGNFATGAAPLPEGVGSGSGTDSAPASSSSAAAAAPTGNSGAVPAAPVPATPAPAAGSGSSAGAQSGPCSNEGDWACSADGSSYQRCASGTWSVTMAMAQGMKCTPGTSTTINMVAAR